MRRRCGRRQQRGVTLLIGLIMLVLMTLLAVTAFNLGKSNLKVVGNMQSHDEAVATAKSAIEEVLSKTDFAANPATAFGAGNTKSYTVNGRVGAVTVALSPQPCIKSYQVLPADPNDVTSLGCAAGVQQNFGQPGAPTAGAACADIVWEITAVATDNVTEASATVVQGIRIRDDASAAMSTTNYCP